VYNSEAPIEEQVVSLLKGLKKTITTAESITGGMISAAITSVEGASECFKVGYVSYSNKAKRKLLSVKKELLRKEGAVSSSVAKEMAIGAMMESEADLAVAVTGNAGPTALEDKEIGLVYIAVCAGGKTKVEEYHFTGTRKEIREQCCNTALVMVRNYLLEKMT
jgi:competence/damage-inducible protein cinA C-terminal domain